MQLGIFAKTFAGHTPAEALSASATAGYACVQYNMACSGLASMPDAISIEDAECVAAAAQKYAVNIAAVSATFNMIHPNMAVVEKGLQRLEVIAERCKIMNTRIVTLCTGTRDPDDQWRHHPDNASPEAWADLLRALEKALQIAERHDVILGVEPELSNVISSAQHAQRLLSELSSPRLGIILDAANLFEEEDIAAQRRIVGRSINLLAGNIIMAHAKDRTADGTFVAAGTGVLDYPHYLKSLRQAGFDGPLITHGLAAAEATSVARFLQRELAA